ncbi:MAG: hypothetical protein ACSHX8_14145 [Opitutaceae bacterium]
MKIQIPTSLLKFIALAIITSASLSTPSHAGEKGLSDLLGGKSEKLVPFQECVPLFVYKFISPVDGRSNSWRSDVNISRNRLNITLKTGRWERPDANELKDIWLSYEQDWAKVDTYGKALRFRYEFDESSIGAASVFKFGASKDSRRSHRGNYSLSLVYGGKSCVFSANGLETGGELPFEITAGTTVVLDLNPDNTVTIKINDMLILNDQPVDFAENYVTIALKDTTNRSVPPPQVLRLRDFVVSLGD